MKKEINQPVNHISKEQLAVFINEKETIAIGLANVNNKVFGTVDLWNIQRQKKSRIHKPLFS